MSIHSKKGSTLSESKSDEEIFRDSHINLGPDSQSDTCMCKEIRSKVKTSISHNVSSLMSELMFPAEELKGVVKHVSMTEGVPNAGNDESTLVFELEKEVAMLKIENSQLETKLKETGNLLSNAKTKIEAGLSSQEMNVVIHHLKEELNMVKMKNNRLQELQHSYEYDIMETKEPLADFIKERLNLQELLDIIKRIVEPEQYNSIMEAYRQKFRKELITDQSVTSMECISVQTNEKQTKERKPSSRKKSGRSIKEDSGLLEMFSVSVQTESTKKSSNAERQKLKGKIHQAESELLISKEENESLIKKGGQNEALWARCLELKEAKESIEKQFMLYKQSKSDESVGKAGGKNSMDGDDSKHTKGLESMNGKEISRETLLTSMNQINQLKVESNRLRNENRNLTLQCQHFQRLALFTQPNLVFEETRINH